MRTLVAADEPPDRQPQPVAWPVATTAPGTIGGYVIDWSEVPSSATINTMTWVGQGIQR